MPVTVPADGELGDRVTRIAAVTRQRKSRARGSSATLLVPAFLLLARAGLLRPFVNHQRFVNTFVTNLRGPDAPLSLGGRLVDTVIALPATTGNVTVTLGVLSYAGVLRITLLSDPARVADIGRLILAVTRELKGLTSGIRHYAEDRTKAAMEPRSSAEIGTLDGVGISGRFPGNFPAVYPVSHGFQSRSKRKADGRLSCVLTRRRLALSIRGRAPARPAAPSAPGSRCTRPSGFLRGCGSRSPRSRRSERRRHRCRRRGR